MATITWNLQFANGNWSTAADWFPASVPAADDDVIIPSLFPPSFTITLDVNTAPLDSLTIQFPQFDAFPQFVLNVGDFTLDISGTGSGATDTLSTAGAIALSGGTINAQTVSFTELGSIGGFGTVNVSGHYTSSADGVGLLIASGGTLDLFGTIDSSVGLLGADGGTLKIEGAATASSAVEFVSGFSNDKLEIGASGHLTILASQYITNDGTSTDTSTNGTIQLDGGSLTMSGDAILTIHSGARLIGSGLVTGAIAGSGVVEANAGTLELVNGIAAKSGTAFEISNNPSSDLLLDGAVGGGNTFTFLGGNGELTLANDTGFHDTISGLHVGTGGAMTNFIDIASHTVTIGAVTGQGTTSGTIALSDGAILDLTNLGSTAWFANAVSDGFNGTDIFVSDIACYCRGTLIEVACGQEKVEMLRIGDKVRTASGALRPIKWIGRRSYAGRLMMGRKDIRPICIKAGALDDRVPNRDLWISPHHAMYFEAEGGVLVEAKDLVNGASVVQAERVEKVEYFHIELDTHDVIIAEGALSETFIDDDSRGMFHNAHEYHVLYPDPGVTPAVPYCAPRLQEGYGLEAVRQRIAARVQAAADPEGIAVYRRMARQSR